MISINQLNSNELICEEISSKINMRHSPTRNATQEAIVSYAGGWLKCLHSIPVPLSLYNFHRMIRLQSEIRDKGNRLKFAHKSEK
jgi:hypothetical protein